MLLADREGDWAFWTPTPGRVRFWGGQYFSTPTGPKMAFFKGKIAGIGVGKTDPRGRQPIGQAFYSLKHPLPPGQVKRSPFQNSTNQLLCCASIENSPKRSQTIFSHKFSNNFCTFPTPFGEPLAGAVKFHTWTRVHTCITDRARAPMHALDVETEMVVSAISKNSIPSCNVQPIPANIHICL